MPTIAPVEIMLRIIFWAVPAFKRVEPVSTSGPTTGSMARSAAFPPRLPALHAMATVLQPRDLAYCSPPIT